jgi:hypothetical protein
MFLCGSINRNPHFGTQPAVETFPASPFHLRTTLMLKIAQPFALPEQSVAQAQSLLRANSLRSF